MPKRSVATDASQAPPWNYGEDALVRRIPVAAVLLAGVQVIGVNRVSARSNVDRRTVHDGPNQVADRKCGQKVGEFDKNATRPTGKWKNRVDSRRPK
jgi:hypothetical protein